MTTWSQVNTKLDLFLDDAERAGAARLFPVPLRIESWNWAQRILMHHTPRQRVIAIAIETGKRQIVLPSDFFAMEGIYDTDRERWWRPMRRRPGDVRFTDEELPEFWRWADRVFLEDEISYTSDDLTLYYWAYYPEVEYTIGGDGTITCTQEQICVPSWVELAMCHLTAATCMIPGEIFASDINQYKIRIESGTPLHNPRAQSADFHLAWWNALIDKFPPARGTVME